MRNLLLFSSMVLMVRLFSLSLLRQGSFLVRILSFLRQVDVNSFLKKRHSAGKSIFDIHKHILAFGTGALHGNDHKSPICSKNNVRTIAACKRRK